MKNNDSKSFNSGQGKRLLFIGGFIISIFLIYLYNLFSLQVINSGEYRYKASVLSSRRVEISARRGRIFYRSGEIPLAYDKDAFSIEFTPAATEGISISELLGRVASIAVADLDYLEELIPLKLNNPFRKITLMKGLSLEDISVIAERADEFPGISWSQAPYRYYNLTGSESHFIGYTGSISTKELQILYNKGYSLDSDLGKSGVEKQYDIYMQGIDGYKSNTVDANGRTITEGAVEAMPRNGLDIRLTIDREIQILAQKALGDRVGSVIVLKPSNGEILAMVSSPYYDSNDFTQPGFLFEGGKETMNAPFLNRTIQSAYPPASTFKLILTAAILDTGLFDPERKITCNGYINIGDRVFWCHRRSGHGPLNLREALEQSCNIYFATVGMEILGIEIIYQYAQYFGLVSETGIDLPGEISGVIPTEKWKKENFGSGWQLGDTANASIGQGFVSSTPLQVANEIALIANEGIIYRPHVLKEIFDPYTGAIVEEYQKEVIRTTPIKRETFDILKDYMRGVVTDGTSNTVIFTDSVKIAAKTGTAEAWGLEDRWHSWFASFGPYETDDPDEQIVVVTMVEASNKWDWWAPKAADMIYEGIFGNKTYEQVVEDFKSRGVWYAMDL